MASVEVASVKIMVADKDVEESKNERAGLTTAQAEELYVSVGYNELPHVDVSLSYLFFAQFCGLMPYMLELAALLSIVTLDYIDFIIIVLIVLTNGILGFTEELKAKRSLEELTNSMEQKVAVIRDGKAQNLVTRFLVPGDVILLVGGVSVPADVDWLEGDVLSIDTAALTGEPLPRFYPCEEYGSSILCGTIVAGGEAYCIVRQTGARTEVGGAQVEIMQDKTETKMSVFEERIMTAVKVLITISIIDVLIIFLVQGFVRRQFFEGGYEGGISTDISGCLGIIIASIPVALPLVMQVTLALGAGEMARVYHAAVTSLPALQDISSMTTLCSDKTGTLTTAKITIIGESIWKNPKANFTVEDVAFYGALGSNRAKIDDAIDRSVIQYFDKHCSQDMQDRAKEYVKTRSVGFSPIYKRVLWEYSHPIHGTITIAKGITNKCIDTAAGTVDDAADQWKVQDYEELAPLAEETDFNFSKAGYKTLGVSVKVGTGPWQFVGILPMIDPPRADTAQTIANIRKAGISVKMITGDHLNIAKETARLVGLGTNIHKGEVTREPGETTKEIIKAADGFAQVLPRDKREVVTVLRNHYGEVVGMTGDGVNDAPALSAAQCGVAVDDATDAAKNAAAIILTSPGLSAIYSAIVSSRKIFRKLKAYVVYRFSASIQIVVTLTVLIFLSDCSVNSLYIVLLALFNDLSMLPVAYDIQMASASPENPDVNRILIMSFVLGITEVLFSLLWAYGIQNSGALHDTEFSLHDCTKEAQSAIWVQLFVSAELVIFATRVPGFAIASFAPSPLLAGSVFLFCLLVSILAITSGTFGGIYVSDVAVIWAYCICTFFFVDAIKVVVLHIFDEDSNVLPELGMEDGAVATEKEPDSAEEAADATKSNVTAVTRMPQHQASLSGVSNLSRHRVGSLRPHVPGTPSVKVPTYKFTSK